MQDLTNFLSEFYSSGVSFYKSLNKKLSSLFDITKVSDVTTKIDQNIKFFYQTSQLFINSIQVFLGKLSLALITPLKEFKINYEKKNKEIKKNFEIISNDFKAFKQKVIFSQQKYYAKEQDYIKIKSELNLKKLKNKFTDRDQDALYTAKSKAMNEKEIYKYQVLSANIFYQNLDLMYKKNYKNFEISEENKFVFLNDLFGMYSNNMKDLSMYINDYCGQINSKFAGWKLDDDKKIIKDEFNCMGRYIINKEKDKNLNNKEKYNVKSIERFNKETFKAYNNINIKYVNDFFEILDNNKKGFFSRNKTKIFGYIIESKDRKEESTTYKTYDIQSNEYQKNIMKLFFDSLDSQNELTSDIISSIIELIINDKKFPQYFFKDYYVTHNTQYIRMLNEKNLEHFGNILATIILLNDLDKNDILNIIANIIYFGERVYYLIPNAENKKLFLCSFLNKMPLFKCIYFWESLIRYKLVNHLEKLANEIDEKFEGMNKVNKKYNHNMNDYNNNNFYYDTGMNIYEELNTTDESVDTNKNYKKNLYLKNRNKENKTNDSNLLIAIINYDENYEDLTIELKNEYNKKSHQIFNSILLGYISSFVNYNFGLNNSLDLLVKICNEFSMSNDIINYFAVYLNNCSYSVKQYSKNSFYDLKNKIEDIRVDLKLNSIKKQNQNYDRNIENEKEKRRFNDSEKMIIIKKVSRFLPDKDKINILKLNKKFSSKLNKKIYKEILNRKDKEIGIINNKQMHINVWKILLKYNLIKKTYPYYPNLEKAKKIKYDMSGKNDFCVIDLDSQRTLFEENNKLEEKRKVLNNILKTCTMLNEEGCYCQGMNFVGAFIIKIIENEEDSFYFLMGLFKYTDYRSIFTKDLSKLRQYFSVFDVILKLYMPTLDSYFEENKVKSNYYLSAWFIALFTSLVKQGKKLEAFLKIFDLFIIDGWKAIFNISMDILRKNEEILLTKKNEGLLHYLTSSLGSDFVLNKENYEYLLNNNVNKRLVLRISGKLIHNIENEINQTEKLKEKLK